MKTDSGDVLLRMQERRDWAAEFAEILKESFWARGSRLSSLLRDAEEVGEEFRGSDDARELIELIDRAARIQDGDDYDERPRRPNRR